MRKAVAMGAPAFGVALLAAGTAFAVTKMCPGNCRGTGDDDRLVGSARANTIYAEDGDDSVVGRDEVYGGGAATGSRGAPARTRSTAAPATTW